VSDTGINKLSADLHPPLTDHEAIVEADRCYFCFDAPCVNACPTGIDIPLFIRQIKTGNPKGAATTIFNENIFGGMCARVCPTETLCEEKCVRHAGEEKPVLIGLLQRYATDVMMATNQQPFTRAEQRATKVAVVGAGPAGISCAHRLALYGHQVTVFDANNKAGGLNEYGIAAYKTVDSFAAREVDYILSIGGIDVKHDKVLGKDITLEELKKDYDAVFLGMGLGGVNSLELNESNGVEDAVEFISRLRQSEDYSQMTSSMGRHVVVVGGGMTAIDAAVQSKLLGVENVTVAYRRDQSQMNASVFEQELAQKNGVLLRTNLQPVEVMSDAKGVTAMRFEYTDSSSGKLKGTGETLDIPCDHLLVAIGQTLLPEALGNQTHVKLSNGRIDVDENRRTSAVQDGKLAAESINQTLETTHG